MCRESHPSCWHWETLLVELRTWIGFTLVHREISIIVCKTGSIKTIIQDPKLGSLKKGKNLQSDRKISSSLFCSSGLPILQFLLLESAIETCLEPSCIVEARTAQQRQHTGRTRARFDSRYREPRPRLKVFLRTSRKVFPDP